MRDNMTIPSSTYRVQLHADFNFRHLGDILDYLHDLGITTLYASPITQAVPGSQHGYDVSTPESLNTEIGTEEELGRLSAVLKAYEMTWLQDIVPNHMAYDQHNPWLYDVLERGPRSEYHPFFDIERSSSEDKLMAPFLGNPLAECLRDHEITLDLAPQGFVIRYYDNAWPVAISAYGWLCMEVMNAPPGLAAFILTLEGMADSSLDNWNHSKQYWLEEMQANTSWISFIRQLLTFFNERPFLLAELLSRQYYLLQHARAAAGQINYRRFFTVNSLICLRMEDEKVFAAYHRKIIDWYRRGYIQGLRIDHIDGLAEPGNYINRLRQAFGNDMYMVAEKIMAADEPFPENWALQGTTGYEFLALADQLFTDPEGIDRLKCFYLECIAPGTPAYQDLIVERKYHYGKGRMGGELNNLLRLLYAADLLDGRQADAERMKEALAILMASFPVYRLYPETIPLPEYSQRLIEQAFSRARQRAAEYMQELELIRHCLEHTGFFTRLMQFTGPLAAKGIEDTTFYIYDPLISLNEVGDTPAMNGLTVEAFHGKMKERLQTLPHSLNAGSTHDTKRGEDSRIRLDYLTAIPGEWIGEVIKWRKLNEGFKLSPNDEYFIYQSLLGAIPEDLVITDPFRQRFHGFLTKALREADSHTHYDPPDEEYEGSCHAFVDAILSPGSAFLDSFLPLAGRVIGQAMDLSLAQLLLRLTAPGIPDIYQGAECWDLSLVDPDNRRPVDFQARKALLKNIREEETKGWPGLQAFIAANKQAGAGKMFVIYKTLSYRRQFPALFASGEYIPVEIDGPMLSYLRRDNGQWALICVPLIRKAPYQQHMMNGRLSLAPRICRLPAEAPTTWTNLFTGDKLCQSENGPGQNSLDLSGILAKFPVVLLTAQV